MDNTGNSNPEREQYIRQFDAGQYIKQLRGDRSLASVCKLLKVSPAHLSEIERGKMPSDHLISALARVYEVDENDLFRRWGKVPILAKEEVANNVTLQNTLAEIARNTKLTDDEKNDLYDNIYQTYRRFIERLTDKKEGRGQ